MVMSEYVKYPPTSGLQMYFGMGWGRLLNVLGLSVKSLALHNDKGGIRSSPQRPASLYSMKCCKEGMTGGKVWFIWSPLNRGVFKGLWKE